MLNYLEAKMKGLFSNHTIPSIENRAMKVLFFDTETSCFYPKNDNLKTLNNINIFPNIVQFSYIIYEFQQNSGRTCKVVDNIVKIPEKIEITTECTKVHGITKEISIEKGVPIEHIMMNFLHDIENVDFILGHNLEFDLKMAIIEMERIIASSKNIKNVNYYLNKLEFIKKYENYYCTMKESTEICKIVKTNSRGKYFKFPSLTELHEFCFKSTPKNLHNSLNDVAVGLRCFGYLEFNRDICEEDEIICNLLNKLL